VQYIRYAEFANYVQYTHYAQYLQYTHYAQYEQYVDYEEYAQYYLRYSIPISLLLSNLSTHSTDNRHDRSTNSVPSAAQATHCVDIASVSVLPVALCTWYVHVVSGSGRTGETSGKCCFVSIFMVCTVHIMFLRLQNERKEIGRTCGTSGEQETFIHGIGGET
jgi:hypothetical protein